MAINTRTVVPTLIGAALIQKLRNKVVFAGRVNRTWQSAANQAGQSVIINIYGDATVKNYTSGATITYDDADVGTAQTLTLDKAKYWAVKYDDLDRAKSSIDLLSQGVNEAATMLAEQVDDDVRTVQLAAATAAQATALNIGANNIKIESMDLDYFHRKLNEANVPMAGRFMIVGPHTAQFVQRAALSNEFILSSPTTQTLVNGLLGSFAGFNWYVAPAKYSTVSSGNATEQLLCGVDYSTAFIDQVNRTESMRPSETFADVVRGLYNYGSKVIQPEGLLKSAVTVSGVTA